MRFRRIAGITLLALQAFVAARPFAALPEAASLPERAAAPSVVVGGPHAHHEPDTPAPAAVHVAEHHAADHHAADHHAADHASNSRTPHPGGNATPDSPAPSHDHGAAACHAGTPCCAPTLPVTLVTVPAGRTVPVASAPQPPHQPVYARVLARRLPPATAPPATAPMAQASRAVS